MKKINYVLILAMMLVMANVSTSSAIEEQAKKTQKDKIEIVVTTFPIYDFVREIIGKGNTNFNVKIIIDNGIDLHNFQPSTEDIANISNADVFIYNGGESDLWVKKILTQAMNKNMKVISIMDSLGDKVKEELIVEGMEEHSHAGHAHHGHKHNEHKHHGHKGHSHAGHENCEHGHEHDETIYDEHVWLSLKNAVLIVKNISNELQALDSVNAANYESNTKSYIDKLNELDVKHTKLLQRTRKKHMVLFADRFPFRYLMDDYGIAYYAAFPGCSAETEASFETVIFLAKKINELNLKNIFIIDNSTNNIAKTVIQSSNNKDANILSLNSLQTVTAKELEEGVSYLAIMEENLLKLHKALEQ